MIKTVGVLGAGLMGSGIAEVTAKAGYTTIVREVSEDLSRKGRARIEASLARAVEKGKLDGADRDAARARLSETTRLEDLADCDIVIEAIVENLETKNETFAALDRACKPKTIFSSNTSSLTITEMSAATSRPDRFAGLSRIEQHRLVYDVFGGEIGGPIHALSLRTTIPEGQA